MDLLPTESVTTFSMRNGEALARIHGWFADVVPQVFAEMEPRHPDGRIHGGVFSANVRDAFLYEVESGGMTVAGLEAIERPFRSVRFIDREGWGCRVHMHPRSLKTGRYLPTTAAQATLFGDGFEEMPYELAVFWRPSRRTKALQSISLAAVANIEDRHRTVIYASAPLPPVSMDQYWTPTVSDLHIEPMDDFDDYFTEDEGFGDEPA